MPTFNENRVITKACPVCGIQRPLDWFGSLMKHVVYKKDGSVSSVIRYRKYHACWKCRALKGIDLLAIPPISEEQGER